MTDFGWALVALKAGKRMQREGWNGKGMWLKLVRPINYAVQMNMDPEIDSYIDQLAGKLEPDGIELLPWIGMKTADDKFVPWLASQTDILAEDWEIVE